MVKSLVISQTLPSDHFCLPAHLHLSPPPPPPPPLSPLQKVYVQARNFTAVDMAVLTLISRPGWLWFYVLLLTVFIKPSAICLISTPPVWSLTVLRPPSPWLPLVGSQLLEAKRERRRTERQWLKSDLKVLKLIFQTATSAVNAIVHSSKTAYYNTKILACSTSKQLHNIIITLLG